MNEVTKVHLGRQAFAISVAARKELNAYHEDIAKQVADHGVIDEIELRMAELLTERGVTDDKVVLPTDIKFLKKQLGDPKDFKDDESPARPAEAPSGRRLFRDTDNAWIAGVAAGISAYFGLDAWLIRLLFVLGAFAWGGSVLLYIALWLLVPEAKTSSDRLQMAGKPITVDSLKDAVQRADVKGAAHRAGDNLSEPAERVRDGLNNMFSFLVRLVGVGLTLMGLGMLIGLAFCGTYVLVHGNIIYDNLFPVGIKEHVLLYLAVFVAAMVSIFVLLFGMTIYRRKWPLRGWVTGVLVGLTLIGMVGAGALAADTVPTVRDRYNAHLHTVVRQLKPFSGVSARGDGYVLNFQGSDKYSVSLKYFDNANVGAIKTNVENGILYIDSSGFNSQRVCDSWCIPDTYDMQVTVYSPNLPQTSIYGPGKPIFMGPVFNHP